MNDAAMKTPDLVAYFPQAVLWILALCALIMAIGGAIVMLNKLSAPIKRIEERLDKLEARHDKDQSTNEKKLEQDHKDIGMLNESNRHICECMMALMDHEITGNSVERLKEARNDMNSFLINR